MAENFLKFENNCGWVMVKMVVAYTIDDSGTRIRETAYNMQTIRLPGGSRNIEVWFECLRFAWCYAYVKKWNRQLKEWETPTVRELFRFDTPPKRRFVAYGLLYDEAIREVVDEHGVQV